MHLLSKFKLAGVTKKKFLNKLCRYAKKVGLPFIRYERISDLFEKTVDVAFEKMPKIKITKQNFSRCFPILNK